MILAKEEKRKKDKEECGIRLIKVSTKKNWEYQYDTLEDMLENLSSMHKAGFNIEKVDYTNLSVILSQTIYDLDKFEP